MKATITKRTDTEVTLQIVASSAELKHALEHAYSHYRPQVKAAGFRPGKAPDNIVAREIGDATIQSEVLDHAIGHAYSDAVNQEKLAVVAQPTVTIQKWVPYDTLEFEAVVSVIPPVKLADYKKINKPVKEPEVTDAQVEDMIDDLRRRVAKRVPAIRAAEVGDEVKIDFVGTKGGQPVEGATGANYTLKLGSNTFIPGFEDELVGLKVGEEKTFTVTFPANYHEQSLAGQPVEFTVTVHEVTELELPEVTDKFASEVGPFKTVKELKADIRDQLKAEAEQLAKREYENELLEDIIKKSDAKAPDALVGQQLERLKVEMNQRLAQSGLSMDQYLQMQQKSQEELEKELRPEAEKRVQLALILSEVAKEEKLTVGQDEIENEIAGLRAQYTDPVMQKELAGDQIREDVYNHLMSTKVINKLTQYAQSK
jgi:trigger factor